MNNAFNFRVVFSLFFFFLGIGFFSSFAWSQNEEEFEIVIIDKETSNAVAEGQIKISNEQDYSKTIDFKKGKAIFIIPRAVYTQPVYISIKSDGYAILQDTVKLSPTIKFELQKLNDPGSSHDLFIYLLIFIIVIIQLLVFGTTWVRIKKLRGALSKKSSYRIENIEISKNDAESTELDEILKNIRLYSIQNSPSDNVVNVNESNGNPDDVIVESASEKKSFDAVLEVAISSKFSKDEIGIYRLNESSINALEKKYSSEFVFLSTKEVNEPSQNLSDVETYLDICLETEKKRKEQKWIMIQNIEKPNQIKRIMLKSLAKYEKLGWKLKEEN